MTGRFDNGSGKPLVLTLPAEVVLPDAVGVEWPSAEALADPFTVVEAEDEELVELAELPTLMSWNGLPHSE